MRVLSFFLPAMLMAQGGAQAPTKAPTPAPKAAAGPTLTTDDEKAIYALGLQMYKSLGQFDLSPAELEIIKKALSDASVNKPALDAATWMPKVGTLAGLRGQRVAEREKAASAAYLV